MHIHACECFFVYIHTYTHTCTWVRIHLYPCMCTYNAENSTYIYVRIYIHSYTHDKKRHWLRMSWIPVPICMYDMHTHTNNIISERDPDQGVSPYILHTHTHTHTHIRKRPCPRGSSERGRTMAWNGCKRLGGISLEKKKRRCFDRRWRYLVCVCVCVLAGMYVMLCVYFCAYTQKKKSHYLDRQWRYDVCMYNDTQYRTSAIEAINHIPTNMQTTHP